jgi:hypothetical protein
VLSEKRTKLKRLNLLLLELQIQLPLNRKKVLMKMMKMTKAKRLL